MKEKYPTDLANPITPLRAIRLNCLQCLGWDAKEVKNCKGEQLCFLWPFRFGKRPKAADRIDPIENPQTDNEPIDE